MNINNVLTIIIVALLKIPLVLCFFDPITLGISGSIGAGLIGVGYHKFIKCRIYECCNDEYIPINVTELQRQLATRLHGQHIVQKTVVPAIRGYKNSKNRKKALTLSFHGPTGTGKNFVSGIISSAFYKEGKLSKFYHLFSGSTYSTSRLEEHKEHIKNTIVESLQQCERSIFVFDEVDSMPMGLLNILLPFLDYAQPIFLEYKSKRIRINSNNAVFIFLSNAGERRILEQMLILWKEGRKRDSLRQHDFENLISGGALKEEGGFMNSHVIRSSLIDHFVPFLPLEEEHIKMCMRAAFEEDMYPNPPTPSMEEYVLSVVTYGPPPYNIYSQSGCKKIETKALSARYIDKKIDVSI